LNEALQLLDFLDGAWLHDGLLLFGCGVCKEEHLALLILVLIGLMDHIMGCGKEALGLAVEIECYRLRLGRSSEHLHAAEVFEHIY
jgi:hypothetical protein